MSTPDQQHIDLTKLATAVAAAMIPLDKRLWDSVQCAEYLHKNKRVFLERYAPMPTFPKCIRLPNTRGGRSQSLWKTQEVIDWAMKYQEKR